MRQRKLVERAAGATGDVQDTHRLALLASFEKACDRRNDLAAHRVRSTQEQKLDARVVEFRGTIAKVAVRLPMKIAAKVFRIALELSIRRQITNLAFTCALHYARELTR